MSPTRRVPRLLSERAGQCRAHIITLDVRYRCWKALGSIGTVAQPAHLSSESPLTATDTADDSWRTSSSLRAIRFDSVSRPGDYHEGLIVAAKAEFRTARRRSKSTTRQRRGRQGKWSASH